MSLRWTPLLIVSLLAVAVPSVGAQELEPFTTEVALDVRQVDIADVTPDGRWVAAMISTRRGRTDVDHTRFGDPTYIAPSYGELLVVDARTGAERSLFDEPVQVREPTWSPDGGRLAFLLRQGNDFLLRVWERDGGVLRAVSLDTDKALSSGSSLTWTPDGDRLLVGLRPAGWAEEARAAFLERTEGPVVVQDSRNDFLAWDRVRNLDDREIPALVAVDDGEVTELLPETPVVDARFTGDGAELVYLTARELRTAYRRGEGTEYTLSRMPLDGGDPMVVLGPTEDRPELSWTEDARAFAWSEDGDVRVRRLDADSAENLTAGRRADPDVPGDSLRFSVVRWSPDGEALLVSSEVGWHLLQADGSAMERVLELEEDEDARPRRTVEGWTGDGRALLVSVSARDRWHRGLRRFDLEDRAFTDVVMDEGLYRDWTFSRDGSRAVYRRSDGDRPDELWTLDTDGGSARALTDLNPALDRVGLAHTELVDYLDVDGNRLHGILYYPPGWEAGRTYPLVTEVYEDFFDNGFNENMNLVTARGWMGFRPSVRFETGYPGEAWIKAVPNAVNVLIDRELVDPDRVGVYGQSYGGYAVNLLVTQTDRFAAAANISGKVNIISFLGDSPRITTRNYRAAEEGQDRIGATLWEQPQKYVATSAVMFADRIDTPLLLLSGEADWNVPATNQREMYYALRRLGKEVVWVNYVNGGHGAGRASSAEDFHDHWRRLLDWFDEHFQEKDQTAADGGG